jgi:RND family efflux transporter MFP subunit
MQWFEPSSPIIPAEQRRAKRTAIKVITTQIVYTDNDIRYEALGTARAKSSVDLYPAVAEEITAVRFEAGQRVDKGQLLVQLDDRAEKLAKELAQVKLSEARDLLKRYEGAAKNGAVPESEVDAARAAAQAAKVAYEQADLALDYRQIKAPFAGVVGIPRVDPGERVTTTTLIAGLDQRDILLVDFQIPEKLAGSLKVGQMITATTPAFPGREFSGRVSALESRVERNSRTILSRAEIDNANDLLRPGMSFSLTLSIPGEAFGTIPEIGIQWGHKGSFVWLVRDAKAVQVPVAIVSRTAGTVRVEGSLREGEHVVIEGLQRLEPQRTVEIIGTIPNPAGSVSDAPKSNKRELSS